MFYPFSGKVKSRNVTGSAAARSSRARYRRAVGPAALPLAAAGAIVAAGASTRARPIPLTGATMPLTEDEERDISLELERLRQEHRDLDTAIEALAALVVADRLQLQRLKKRKLALRDRISYLEDMRTPDIIA